MINPLRPFLYVENNFLCIKSYTSTSNEYPTIQFTVDNNKVKIYESFKATVLTPLLIASLAIIMMIALIYDIKIGYSAISVIEIITALILGLIVFVCIGLRAIYENIGQTAYNHLINDDREWLDKKFRTLWITIDDGYTILTTAEAEQAEIDKMRKK